MTAPHRPSAESLQKQNSEVDHDFLFLQPCSIVSSSQREKLGIVATSSNIRVFHLASR